MLGNYFYHEIIRKTVIAFGTLFNDIHVRHQDQAGNDISDIKVPVASLCFKDPFLQEVQYSRTKTSQHFTIRAKDTFIF